MEIFFLFSFFLHFFRHDSYMNIISCLLVNNLLYFTIIPHDYNTIITYTIINYTNNCIFDRNVFIKNILIDVFL